MTDTAPKIDLAAIDYPTDKLTVKMIRKRFPKAFDVEPESDAYTGNGLRPLHRVSIDNVLAAVVDYERVLADWAFKEALGQPVSKAGRRLLDRETTVESLASDYVKFGLARGEHEANELVRGIEAQAAAQARQHGGRPFP
jgi:hypothetical protein